MSKSIGDRSVIPAGAKVVVITLEDSTGRQESATRHLAEMGIERFEFFRAKRHPLKGKVGAFTSHADVVMRALSDPSCEYLYLFEDDLRPGPSYDRNIMGEVATWMTQKRASEWNAIYLGYSYIHPWHSDSGTLRFLAAQYVSDHIVEYDGPILLTHALILSRAGMQHIAEACARELETRTREGTLPHIVQFDAFVSDVLSTKKGLFCVVPLQVDQQWCQPTNNDIDKSDVKDVVIRSQACLADRTEIFTLLSYARPYRVLVVACLMLLLAVVAWLAVKLARRLVSRFAPLKTAKARVRRTYGLEGN